LKKVVFVVTRKPRRWTLTYGGDRLVEDAPLHTEAS